jgi:hypothetical protein
MMPSSVTWFRLLRAGLKVIVSLSFGCAGHPPAQKTSAVSEASKPGWIKMIGIAEADGQLKEVYAAMKARAGSRPAVYNRSGDAPNIVKSHSLEPEGLRLAFGISGAIHWSEKSLPWVQREMINTVTSRANNCFY